MATACISRQIQLASGTYSWGHVMLNQEGHQERSIYLTAANYNWKECIDPRSGYYTLTGSLQVIVDSDPLPAAHLEPLDIDIRGMSDEDQNWTWGSYINPNF